MSEITVTVSGPVGCGKSAIAGEIEIALKAIGVPVCFADESGMHSEKNMTGADWAAYLEMYSPSVVIVDATPPPSSHSPTEALQFPPIPGIRIRDGRRERIARPAIASETRDNTWDLPTVVGIADGDHCFMGYIQPLEWKEHYNPCLVYRAQTPFGVYRVFEMRNGEWSWSFSGDIADSEDGIGMKYARGEGANEQEAKALANLHFTGCIVSVIQILPMEQNAPTTPAPSSREVG
jgi:hypothetical protein